VGPEYTVIVVSFDFRLGRESLMEQFDAKFDWLSGVTEKVESRSERNPHDFARPNPCPLLSAQKLRPQGQTGGSRPPKSWICASTRYPLVHCWLEAEEEFARTRSHFYGALKRRKIWGPTCLPTFLAEYAEYATKSPVKCVPFESTLQTVPLPERTKPARRIDPWAALSAFDLVRIRRTSPLVKQLVDLMVTASPHRYPGVRKMATALKDLANGRDWMRRRIAEIDSYLAPTK
jgi:hypothetical protein